MRLSAFRERRLRRCRAVFQRCLRVRRDFSEFSTTVRRCSAARRARISAAAGEGASSADAICDALISLFSLGGERLSAIGGRTVGASLRSIIPFPEWRAMPRRCTAARLHSVGIDLRIFRTFARHFEDIHRSVIRPAERAPHRRTADVRCRIRYECTHGSYLRCRQMPPRVMMKSSAFGQHGQTEFRTLLCAAGFLTPRILPCRADIAARHRADLAARFAHAAYLHTAVSPVARSLYKLAPPPCFRCTDFDGFCRRAYFKNKISTFLFGKSRFFHLSRLTVSVADIAVPIEVIVPVSEEKRVHVFPNGVVIIISGVPVFVVVVGVVEAAIDVIGVFVRRSRNRDLLCDARRMSRDREYLTH